MRKDYYKNIKIGMGCGFEEVCDQDAYRGKCYKKDGLRWIHDIEALKTSLNFDDEEELKQEGYDVEAYYYYIGYRDGVINKKLALQFIKSTIYSNDSIISGRFDLLKNKEILDEMVSLFCEGFHKGYREEALVNYAYQELKW